MHELLIYIKLAVASVRAKMEYKVVFIFMFFALIIYSLGQLGVILVVVNKFKSINGWDLGEMAFLYGMLVFSQAVASLLFSPLVQFETHIIEGTFDRYLLRPLNPLGQILAGSFEIGSFPYLLIGTAALWFGSAKAMVQWSLFKGMAFILVVSGAVLILGGIRIAVSAVAFWTTRNRSLVHIIVFSSKEMILYPVSIFSHSVQIFLTLVFPIAFVNFYPSYMFLDKDPSGLMFHPDIQYFTPIVGVIVFTLSYALFKVGMNRYQSVGN
jgi:ABC-2 type transport system permease protein